MREKWEAAQKAEREAHSGSFEQGLEVYRDSYRQYFLHLGMAPYQAGKKIMEIGPADFPALSYCHNFGPSHIIEPMPSWMLEKRIEGLPITIHRTAVEDMEHLIAVDEVWIFNVYQHVLDPKIMFEYAKSCAEVVRFFEPIDLPLDVCHLHSWSLDQFKEVFGNCVNLYKAVPGVKNFHAADCAFGVWVKNAYKK